MSLGHAWGFENCNMVLMHEVVCVNACMPRNYAALFFSSLSIPPMLTYLSHFCPLQVRQAAEVHRQVRKYIRTVAKPGVLLSDMCEKLENTVSR